MGKKLFLIHGSVWLRVPAMILLLCITVITVFVAGRREQELSKTPSGTAEGNTHAPDLTEIPIYNTDPETELVNLNGATIKILVTDQERSRSFRGEEEAPTMISRMSREEGQSLAKELNAQLRVVRMASPESYVNTAYAAGERDTADLLLLTAAPEGVGLMCAGRLADLSLFPILNRKSDGIDRELTDALAVCGERFLLFGRGSVGTDDSLTVLTFDRGAPLDRAALYRLVTEGKWTLEEFAVLSRQLETGGLPALTTGSEEALAWWLAAGGCDTANGEDGFTVTLGNTNGRSVFAQLKKTIFAEKTDSDAGTASGSGAVFALSTLAGYGASDPEKVGLLPLPKAAEGGEYLSYANPEKATAFAITSFCDAPERSALIAYYLTDRSAKLFAGENGRDLCGSDSDSLSALRLITRNRRISVLATFGFGEVLRATVSDLVNEQENFSDLLSRRNTLMQFSIDAVINDMQEELARIAWDSMQAENRTETPPESTGDPEKTAG